MNRSGSPRELVLSDHVRISVECYFDQLDGHPASDLYAMVMAEVEKPLITAVMIHCGHNQTKAAKVLGMSRSTLRKKIEFYEL